MAGEVLLLNGSNVNYGALSQTENQPALETIKIKRTAATPDSVTLRYKVNTVVEACVDFELVFTEVSDLTQLNCEPKLNGAYACTEASFEGYQIPKRVCREKGLKLQTNEQSLTLNFKKAITLTENAVEIFAVNVAQRKMTDVESKLSAKAVDTASVYKVRVSGSAVKFKAK